MSTLKQQSISAVKWNILSQITLQGLTLATSLILSRFFLSPKEYGLMGMILVFTGFANVLKDFGIGSAIIQKKELSDEDLSTAFLFNVILGISLTFIFVLASPLIAQFYNDDRLSLITKIVAINFTVSSLNIVQSSLLERELNFKAIFTNNFIAYSVMSIAAISMAYAGFGVWTLVLQPLILSSSFTLILWTKSNWKPIITFSKQSLHHLLKFSIYLLGSTSINYWASNIDNMIVGKYSGAQQLGIYTRAYTLMYLPITQISSILVKVLLPTISRIQDDKEKVANVYMRAIDLIAFVNFPVIVGLVVTADSLLLLLLGEQWQECILIYRILAVASLLRVMVSPIGLLLTGLGETKLHFKFGLVVCIIGIAFIFIGYWTYGVIGVSSSLIFAGIISLLLSIYTIGKVIPFTYGLFFRNVAPIFLAAAVMGLTSFGIGYYLIPKDELFLRLVVEMLVGLVVYVGWSHFFQLKAYKEFVEMSGISKFLPFLK